MASKEKEYCMSFDIFISYAWGAREDTAHREWVRSLASHLHYIGFNVGIDERVDYGSDLTGFMREIADSSHVLMVVDENFIERANCVPSSGVAIESGWIQESIGTKPNNWLSVLYVRNPNKNLPGWMSDRNPKSFDFNYYSENDRFPGEEQIDSLWRWIAGLSADKINSISPTVIRERMYRVEEIDNIRDLGNWSLPYLEGINIEFNYEDAPSKTFTLGYGSYSFNLRVSSCGADSVYVYNDSIRAVGLIPDGIPDGELDAKKAFSYRRSGRTVTPRIGQRVVLVNSSGCVCVVKINDVQQEHNGDEFVPAQIFFDYRIISEEQRQRNASQGISSS